MKERDAGRPRVAALILAAGQSRRMGAANKLLAEVAGVPMVRRAVEAALASRARPVVLVTGHDAEAVRTAAGLPGVAVVHNPSYADGLATSLARGLDALGDIAGNEVEGAIVLLGDMPRITPAVIDRLIAAFAPEEGAEVCMPTYQGRRGNPVLFARHFFPEIMALTGDKGARGLLERHPAAIVEVPLDDAAILLDIDTPEALAAARKEN